MENSKLVNNLLEDSCKATVINGSSDLLTVEELRNLKYLLGPGCETSPYAVVRCYTIEGQPSWVYKGCGVACFVKDKKLRGFFIRVYDVIYCSCILEQKLTAEVEYTQILPQFHIVQFNSNAVGLSFATVSEAEKFSRLITQRLEKKRALVAVTHAPVTSIQPGISYLSHPKQVNLDTKSTKNKTTLKGKKLLRMFGGDTHKQKLTSRDISTPSNFQHIEHVGFDKEAKTYSITAQESETMRSILRSIGYEDAMNNPKECEFVYKFASECGGLEALANYSKGITGSSNIPPRKPPLPATYRQPAATPPIPSTNHPPPPPIPPVAPKPIAPPPPMFPAPPICQNVPIPPPPPLIGPPPSSRENGDFEEISGSTLGSKTGSSAFDIQSEIAGFQKGNLRKITPGQGVSHSTPPVKNNNSTPKGVDLLQSLAQAMEMRRNQMGTEDSDDELGDDADNRDMGSDDEDWDD